MTESETWHVSNEFASVHLRVTPHGRGHRLEIRAGRTETAAYVDATVLEALTLLTESQLMQIVGTATMGGPESPEPN
jgi:hypothetical protein